MIEKLKNWYNQNFDNHYLLPQIYYVAGMFVFPVLITLYYISQNTLDKNIGKVFSVPYLLLLAGTVLIMYKDLKKDFTKKWDKKFFITVGILFCVMFFVNEFGSQVFASIVTRLNLSAGTSENQEIFEALMKIATKQIGVVALVGAVLEEFIFRKALMSYIKNRKAAVIVSTLSFAMMHMSGFSANEFIMLILYIILGLIFSLIYDRTRDIRYSTCVHFLNNLVAVIQTVL